MKIVYIWIYPEDVNVTKHLYKKMYIFLMYFINVKLPT